MKCGQIAGFGEMRSRDKAAGIFGVVGCSSILWVPDGHDRNIYVDSPPDHKDERWVLLMKVLLVTFSDNADHQDNYTVRAHPRHRTVRKRREPQGNPAPPGP